MVEAEQLPAYRRALELHADRASLRTIAATLTAEGFKTAREGSSWHASTVRARLASETARSL